MVMLGESEESQRRRLSMLAVDIDALATGTVIQIRIKM
jgi:hypothetical protein